MTGTWDKGPQMRSVTLLSQVVGSLRLDELASSVVTAVLLVSDL